MSVWIKTSEELQPLGETVLILYKYKMDRLAYDNLYYGIAHEFIHKFFSSSKGTEQWSRFTEYQEYYEVVCWARLYDMPRIKELQNE